MTTPLPRLSSLVPTLAASDLDRCRELLALLDAGLEVLDPESAVMRVLTAEDPPGDDVTVVAIGKAAPAMARGAASVLGDRIRRWVVVSDHPERMPEGTELLVTSHPVPDRTSLAAGRRILELVSGPADHVVFLVSGGGSSLAEIPRRGVSLTDLVAVYRLLLEEGVPIEHANVVRSHVSLIKGGKLAAASSAPMTTVVLSDVGPRLDLVASGPSIPASSSPGDALDVLSRHGLDERVPRSVIDALERAETVPIPSYRVLPAGDGSTAVEAMVAAGERLGLAVSPITTGLRGEAADAARWALGTGAPGEIGVLAGETTVTVRGRGRGGRNQEAALAAALALEGKDGVLVTLGTDGVDGPTDAAGAYVDGSSADRVRRAGIDPEAALAANDSHPALDGARALIRTGPTGINVADLWLVDRREA